jgi:hypothetical protein
MSMTRTGVAIMSSVMAFCAAGPAGADYWGVQKNTELYGNLNQFDVPDLGSQGCGPAAAVNSFWYLQNRYPDVYGADLVPPTGADWDEDGDVDEYDAWIAAANGLGLGFMDTDPDDGTDHDNFIMGKMEYIELLVPDQTRYRAQDPWAWDNHERPEWVTPIRPTWDFLYEELAGCADIELLITLWPGGGHYVTLTSFHWWDDNNDLTIQEGEAFIDFMNPQTGLIEVASELRLLRRAREGDHVADVGHAGDVLDGPLEAQAEAGVGHRAVACAGRGTTSRSSGQAHLLDALIEHVEPLLALRAADDLADARGEHVHRGHGPPSSLSRM